MLVCEFRKAEQSRRIKDIVLGVVGHEVLRTYCPLMSRSEVERTEGVSSGQHDIEPEVAVTLRHILYERWEGQHIHSLSPSDLDTGTFEGSCPD